ncbi:MAG: hypothetical protein GY815_08805 [Gammaproteobacteria bacterium]|nr:hypothetical protein [Gammaproteobacteria bacterium]
MIRANRPVLATKDELTGPVDLELIAAPQLSILCFRMNPVGVEDDAVDRLNTAIRDRVQLEGDYLISPTLVNGRPVLRLCIINHATRAKHVDGLLDRILHIGRDLLSQSDERLLEPHVHLPDNL